jgi:hypothetical protein
VQKPKVVLRLLFPTDQNAAETIHPTMRPFDNPTPRARPSFLLEFLGFFTS